MPCSKLSNTLLDASVSVHRCHLFVTGRDFLALHGFYGDIYEALDGWYDRFAERALADGERNKFKAFDVKVTVPSGTCTTQSTPCPAGTFYSAAANGILDIVTAIPCLGIYAESWQKVEVCAFLNEDARLHADLLPRGDPGCRQGLPEGQ